jgi:hypothetical protein
MRVTEDAMHTMVYCNDAGVEFNSETLNAFIHVAVVDHKLEVCTERYDNKGDVTSKVIEVYHSFRNGDIDYPDLEQYHPLWCAMVNVEDCEVSLA